MRNWLDDRGDDYLDGILFIGLLIMWPVVLIGWLWKKVKRDD